MSLSAPEPTNPPPPPSKPALAQVKELLKAEIDEKTKAFKELPTPAVFAKLETDVKHHGRLIYGMLIAVIAMLITVTGIIIGGYLHFDNKITTETKDIDGRYRYLEDKVNNDIKAMNGRIDSVIIPNHYRPEENKKDPAENNQEN
ncbi:MAG: hypothetical protein K9G62_02540 [Alphaproteobacteria bacterium]|nr:hypothetical protein [Alphaproteobacteria bacterium]